MNECECMNVRMYFAFIPKYTTDFMKELSAIRIINRQVFALSNVVKFGFSEKATKFEKKNLRRTFDKTLVFCVRNSVHCKYLNA